MLKKRSGKVSKRGLYIQDSVLKETAFQPGGKFRFQMDTASNKMTIIPAEEGNTVSKRAKKDGVMNPVIDIRKKGALKMFEGCESLDIEIHHDEIVVTGVREKKEGIVDKTKQSLQSIKEKVFGGSVVDKSHIFRTKEKVQARISKAQLRAVAGEGKYEQLSLFDMGVTSDLEKEVAGRSATHSTALQDLEDAIRVVTFFSGAGIMDQGIVEAGMEVAMAVEIDEQAAETYRQNLGDHVRNIDINKLPDEVMERIGAPIVFMSPPCNLRSGANRHNNNVDDDTNLLYRVACAKTKISEETKIFVIENVPQILTEGDGRVLEEIQEDFPDFELSAGVLNSVDYGSAQSRRRAFIIGSKVGKIDVKSIAPTVSEPATVGEAFEGLHDGIPNQTDFTKPREATAEKMSYVPQGGNWKYIPEHLRTKKMNSGLTHSSIYKRLSWDEPSITIANPRKSNITHPSENRSLSVRECARLFDVPDDFKFFGSLSSKQQQICNSVPVKMAKAVARTVKTAYEQFLVRTQRKLAVV